MRLSLAVNSIAIETCAGTWGKQVFCYQVSRRLFRFLTWTRTAQNLVNLVKVLVCVAHILFSLFPFFFNCFLLRLELVDFFSFFCNPNFNVLLSQLISPWWYFVLTEFELQISLFYFLLSSNVLLPYFYHLWNVFYLLRLRKYQASLLELLKWASIE